ncbi:MAG: hypothetical protein CL681_22370 [Blastopirellula sp.]|nr:hypothetical protein [Blastopirellula sp.]
MFQLDYSKFKILNLFKSALISITIISCPGYSNEKAAQFDESKLSSLVDDLLAGGHLIIIRHAQKYEQGPDAPPVRKAFDTADASLVNPITVPEEFQNDGLGMCLTRLGKANAWLYGEVFRQLNLPVYKVLVSATCRTRQHARIMFPNSDNVQIEPSLVFGDVTSVSQIQATHLAKVRLIQENFSKEANLVVIAHGKTAQEIGLVNFWPKQGEALIFGLNEESKQLVLKAHLSTKDFVLMLPQKTDW